MIEFIKQCKATDANKLKIRDSEVFFQSIKNQTNHLKVSVKILAVKSPP